MTHRTLALGSALILGLTLSACATDSAENSALPVDATVTDIRILNPGAVVVDFMVSYEGTSPTDITCTVAAGGSSNTVTIPQVSPEAVQEAQATVSVTDAAAEDVAASGDASVTCTEA